MDDPFEILGLPRRPWLDERVVRAAFQRCARELHPDAPGGDADKFTSLNSAHALLADPASRLQWLSGREASTGLPADSEFGFRVGSILRDTDAALAKVAAARNPLERALCSAAIADARKSLAALNAELDHRLARADRQLRALDAGWPVVEPSALVALASEFRFLRRWRSQVREREVALSV
jgi:curved DNA-binding protein CbpA